MTATIEAVIPCAAARRGICVRPTELKGQCGAPDPMRNLPCCAIAHQDLTGHFQSKDGLTILTDGERLAQIYRQNILLRQIHMGIIQDFNTPTPSFA